MGRPHARNCMLALVGVCAACLAAWLIRELLLPPLHRAAAFGSVDEVQRLLMAGADPSAATRSGATALHLAAERRDPAIARLLLQHGAPVNARDDHGQTPLHLAVSSGSPLTRTVLLEWGADTSLRDWRGDTPGERVPP